MAASRAAVSGRAIPEDFPSLDSIFEEPTLTKKHVPVSARKPWGQCLAGALAEVAQHGDVRAWLELSMLPKAVLRTALRGGKKNRKKCESETKELCRAWLEGHRGSLWRTARRGSGAGGSKEFSKEQKESRAVELLRESLLQKACGAIANQPRPK